MSIRTGLVLLLFGGGATLLYLALNHTGHLNRDDVLLSIGCSVLQLVATVGFIDTLMERQRRAEECTRIAWKVLHDIESIVWIWLGGSRHFDVNELVGLLREVDDRDVPEPFTINGLISLGASASYTLQTQPHHMNGARRLRDGLEKMVPLAAIRDRQHIALSASAPKTPTQIATALLAATTNVAEFVRLRPLALAGVRYETDASAARQRYRERGEPCEEII